MVKDCRVKLNNDLVTVVDFGGTDVQLPSIHKKAAHVRVLRKNGRYIVVPDTFIEQIVQKPVVVEPVMKEPESNPVEQEVKVVSKKKKSKKAIVEVEEDKSDCIVV